MPELVLGASRPCDQDIGSVRSEFLGHTVEEAGVHRESARTRGTGLPVKPCVFAVGLQPDGPVDVWCHEHDHSMEVVEPYRRVWVVGSLLRTGMSSRGILPIDGHDLIVVNPPTRRKGCPARKVMTKDPIWEVRTAVGTRPLVACVMEETGMIGL